MPTGARVARFLSCVWRVNATRPRSAQNVCGVNECILRCPGRSSDHGSLPKSDAKPQLCGPPSFRHCTPVRYARSGLNTHTSSCNFSPLNTCCARHLDISSCSLPHHNLQACFRSRSHPSIATCSSVQPANTGQIRGESRRSAHRRTSWHIAMCCVPSCDPGGRAGRRTAEPLQR